MLRTTFTALVLALVATTAAQAVPIGGGTTPIYVGQAWFNSGQGAGVSGPTVSACNTSLQQAIALRQSWGWSLQSVTWCQLSPYKGPPYMQIAPSDPTFSQRQAIGALNADLELRERYRIDEYEAERRAIYEQEGDGRR
ncbi:hypothetical protein [Tahibacter amnicola]|uniref:DUF4189 domain-containing protein n=1 Tax=Tahibacter amnicola TaxID=2976241 RepID=A0ABY6BDJ9_9GAMM|nr:hypothetical protein [Tahibacter amnicola]UXI68106.1 hypothetical protein N4264_00175 [Tahibacter amnicola]